MYAVVDFKGKQYKAEKGGLLKVDLVEGEKGAKIDIDSVLLVSGDKVTVGAPYVKGVKVTTVIEEHRREKKIIVFTYKPKKDRRRTIGHRQGYSYLRVQDIVGA